MNQREPVMNQFWWLLLVGWATLFTIQLAACSGANHQAPRGQDGLPPKLVVAVLTNPYEKEHLRLEEIASVLDIDLIRQLIKAGYIVVDEPQNASDQMTLAVRIMGYKNDPDKLLTAQVLLTIEDRTVAVQRVRCQAAKWSSCIKSLNEGIVLDLRKTLLLKSWH